MQNNFQQIQSKINSINILPPMPMLRTLTTHTQFKKWKGCIYLSSYDLTGQMLSYLKNVSSDQTGKYFKNPVYSFVASSKKELESKLTSQIMTLKK